MRLSGGPALPAAMIACWRASSSDLASSLCDVALDVGEKRRRFYAHKLVLACASEQLAALLKAGVTRSIVVPAVTCAAFESLLAFLYTGTCEFEESDLPAVLKAAALLRVPVLLEAATAAVQERLARSPRTPKQLSPPSPREPQRFSPLGPKNACESTCATTYAGTAGPVRSGRGPGGAVMATCVSSATAPRGPSSAHLYVIGGLHASGTAERLDLTSGSWEVVNAAPQVTRRGMAVTAAPAQRDTHAALRGPTRILAIGGHVSGDAVVKNVDELALSSTDAGGGGTSVWVAAPELGTARAYAGAVAANGTVLVCGGHDGINRLRSCEQLRNGSANWSPISPMHTARAYFGCAAGDDGKVYVCGGHDGDSYLAACEVYDPLIDSWRPMAPMSTPRAYHGLQALGGSIYAIGGHDGDGRVATVEKYDPRTDTWNSVAPLSVARAFLGTASDGSRLIAIGGSDAPGHGLSSGESYDPLAGVWRPLAHPMSEARCFPGAAIACGGLASWVA